MAVVACHDCDLLNQLPEGVTATLLCVRCGAVLQRHRPNSIERSLALTMGADSNAGHIALQTVELLVKELGVNITMGASNISFGMPDRAYINSAFVAMAIHAGMTCPITNPLVTPVITAILAADLAMGRDTYGQRRIKAYRKRQKAAEAATQ
jgi:5-methyltetrahydrofolate--homocysteine methyltransferase